MIWKKVDTRDGKFILLEANKKYMDFARLDKDEFSSFTLITKITTYLQKSIEKRKGEIGLTE